MPTGNNEYTVEVVKTGDAALKVSYPATIKGTKDVEIRPKISGFVTKVFVKEGQCVKKGQVLFSIDDAQFRAAVLSARAQIKVCNATIATQKLTVENKRLLYSKNIISDYDMKMAENTLQSTQAQLLAARSQLRAALDNLRWCTITSPADGVIGMLPFKTGALVSPSMSTPFTTVSDISQVHVYFSMTEKQLLEMSRNSNGGVAEAIKLFPSVSLLLADGTLYQTQGKIDAVLIDKQPAQYFIKDQADLSILDEAFAEEDYAIAFKKGNTELKDKVNKALEELKADGTIDKIIGKYIGKYMGRILNG